MVKKSIKIYARLKQENPTKTIVYDVVRTDKHETITFRVSNGLASVVNHKPLVHKFRFQKIFDGNATQSDVFNTIAKPVVNSALHGFNGTIFAYGQTGSGKTYAITGSSENYEERGIIPRSIEEVFDYIKKTPQKYTVYISYMEIYNEIGYDLLNPKQKISCLEELPLMDVAKYRIIGDNFLILHSQSRKVILLEDSKGGSHLRNLSVRKVSTEQEAMGLLFLGDANRIIAETPMNVYSSRSHCIFTICITSKNTQSGKIRRSKLNLVDLAGSERICKTNITGTTLNEAKYINLSLHYLEQVVLALSQKKSHVPFRNSMLTYMLKDSLSGNCMTVLLATLALNKKNIDETIATCKFAQRVAEVNLEAVVNEEVDPQQEIEFLKREVESLRKQLIQQSKFKISGKLTKEEKEKWRKVITNYLNDSNDDLHLADFDVRHIQYCFKLLKEAVKCNQEQKCKLTTEGFHNSKLIESYQIKISEKEDEISTLKSLLYLDRNETDSNIDNLTRSSSIELDKENIPPLTDPFNLSPAQKVAFQIYMEDPKNRFELDHYINSIQKIYEIARNLTDQIEQCQANIVTIRSAINASPNRMTSERLNLELINQQSIYRNSLAKLKDLKTETESFQERMEQAKLNVLENFRLWYESIGQDKRESKLENRAKRNHSHSDLKDIEKDFQLLWSQDGDSGFREGVETPRLHRRSRSTTPSSRECTPIKAFLCSRSNDICGSENLLYNKSNSFSINKENYRLRLNSPRRLSTDIWKPNSNFSNKQSDFHEQISLDIVDDSINNLLANTNLKSFTPNSNLTSKTQNRRSRSKSPKMINDCTSSWIQYQKSFNPRVTNRNRSKSPQVLSGIDPIAICTNDKNETNQRIKSNRASNFSVVYNDIMNRDNHFSYDSLNYLTPEKPYSSNSSDIDSKRSNACNEKGFTKQYWNSHYEQRPSSSRDSPFQILDPSLHFPLKNNKHDIPKISPRLSLNTNEANYRNPIHITEKDNRVDLETSEIKNQSTRSKDCDSLLLSEDSEEFKNFVKTIPLTGDAEVDEEIIKFYRTKFTCKNDS